MPSQVACGWLRWLAVEGVLRRCHEQNMSGSGFVLGSGKKFALHLRQTDGKTHSECDAESCQRRILWHPARYAQNASCAHEART